ncbi:aldehyde dehydrogenase family protein [Microbacterium sp. NPDC086615]|uniref:aldehyde dehydrogenase family protein n=1 Tax=Microbacterium sp. NPDC086615 TaxID=3154865 RepID=UPI00342B13BB
MSDTHTLDVLTVDNLLVYDKFSGDVVAALPQNDVDGARDALARAVAAAPAAAKTARHERAAVLERAARILDERSENVAHLIVTEAGKTIRQARKEVSRAINTLKLSAHEATANAGEVIPFESFPGGEGRRGWFSREPLGVIVAITPYNDALNLVAHKIGPAIAGGNTVVLKPSPHTPLTAQLMVDVLVEAGLPDDVITVVRGDRSVAQALVSAREVRLVSFTGGFATGRAIAAAAGIKRLAMELGGNAPVIVFADADLDSAVSACVSGAFWAAGQNCIGAQRLLVQREMYERFVAAFVEATGRLVHGDPREETTDIGPMISASAAHAARQTVLDAVAAGAHLRIGGTVEGSVMAPTVLTDVPRTCTVWTEEVFAPVVVIEPFDSEEAAIEAANDSEYALQAGVFTQNLSRALRVADAIEAGGVMVNDSSDYRLDAMPFGGAKYGSMGREGVRFAYEEMTQPKVISILT